MNVPGKLCQADGLTAAGHGDILRMKLCNWKKKNGEIMWDGKAAYQLSK